MSKARLEAFSDGVIAILITIMVFDVKAPADSDANALLSVTPGLLAYLLSFLYLGIYWNNHHHMLQAARKINGNVMWANLHLLFWLSLFPFATSWVRFEDLRSVPVIVYGVILLLAGIAYLFLQLSILAADGPGSPLSIALGRDLKGKASLAIYAVGVAVAFQWPWLAIGLYAFVAILWLAPDPRIERSIDRGPQEASTSTTPSPQ